MRVLESAIRGLEVGVTTMTRNEVAILRCRSDYAYGQAGKEPDVPPNATLVFQVELLDFFGKLKELDITFCANHQR